MLRACLPATALPAGVLVIMVRTWSQLSGEVRHVARRRKLTSDGGAGLVLAGGRHDAVGVGVRGLGGDFAVVGLVPLDAGVERRAVGQRAHRSHGHQLRKELVAVRAHSLDDGVARSRPCFTCSEAANRGGQGAHREDDCDASGRHHLDGFLLLVSAWHQLQASTDRLTLQLQGSVQLRLQHPGPGGSPLHSRLKVFQDPFHGYPASVQCSHTPSPPASAARVKHLIRPVELEGPTHQH